MTEIDIKMTDRGFRYEEDFSGSGYVRDNKNGTETIVMDGDNSAPTDMHSEVWVIVYDVEKCEPTHEKVYTNLYEVI